MRKKNIRNSNQSLVLRGQKHSAHKKKKCFKWHMVTAQQLELFYILLQTLIILKREQKHQCFDW